MPNIKSAKKRVRINAAKALKSKQELTSLKTALRKADTAVKTNADDKQEIVKCAVIKLDKACAKGILHKNNAARKKSQLALKCKKA